MVPRRARVVQGPRLHRHHARRRCGPGLRRAYSVSYGVREPLTITLRNAMPTAVPHNTTAVSTIQFHTMAQLPSNSHITLHKLLHTV